MSWTQERILLAADDQLGQRVDDYLASYSDSFLPRDGQSREAWKIDEERVVE